LEARANLEARLLRTGTPDLVTDLEDGSPVRFIRRRRHDKAPSKDLHAVSGQPAGDTVSRLGDRHLALCHSHGNLLSGALFTSATGNGPLPTMITHSK
jgi:hypothetical protein